MSDEEFGRAWAAENGRAPLLDGGGYWWTISGVGPLSHRLPVILFDAMKGSVGICADYRNEAHAYAALGRGLRAIFAEVPPLKGGR